MDRLTPLATLGALYQSGGRYDEAIRACREALELDPGSPGAAHNLALYLVLNKRGADPGAAREAIELARQAVYFSSRGYRTDDELQTKALHTLAIAYASAHRLVDAERAATDALARARAAGRDELASRIEETLQVIGEAP